MKKKKNRIGKILKWAGLTAAGLAVGIAGLSLLGRFLVSEITQEVILKGAILPEEERAEIGKDAPFFDLPGLETKAAKLSDFLGAPLVLTFWTSWNQASADQIKIFDDFLAENPAMGFKILAINNQEDRSAAASFYNRGGYRIPVLLDESGAVGELYAVRVLPATFFIDEEGKIAAVLTGIVSEEALLETLSQFLRR